MNQPTTYDLFHPAPAHPQRNMVDIPPIISGLRYIPEYLSKDDEVTCLKSIESAEWITDLRRRVQHYGWRYDYKARTVLSSMHLGPLPYWAGAIARRLFRDDHTTNVPDQLIVNEYQPGQGIAHHIDCEPCFGETISSISLGAACVMELIHVRTKRKHELLLQPRSLLVLSGPARHEWTHGIPARKTDAWRGEKVQRGLRTSMTFREVIFSGKR